MKRPVLFQMMCLIAVLSGILSARAGTGTVSGSPEPNADQILSTKVAGENIMFGDSQESFYYTLMQPVEMNVGNAINLTYSASHYQNAMLTLRTSGLAILPQSIVIRQFHAVDPALPAKYTYEQNMLTQTAAEYRLDLSKVHDYDASDASLYFAFTGGDARLEMELVSGGATLLKKTFDFKVSDQKGLAELVRRPDANANALQKTGSVIFGIGLDDTKASGTIQSYMDELAKQNWSWSCDIKASGGITLEEQGSLPISKDSITALGQRQWFIRSVNVANQENQSGTVEITMGNPVPEFSKYATADGLIAVTYLRLYHEWKYDLVNWKPGSSAAIAAAAALQNTVAATPATASSAPTVTGNSGTAGSSPKNSSQPLSPIVKYGLIPLGGAAASGGFYLLFLFIFHAMSYLVKISGVEIKDSTDEVLTMQGKILKELRTTIKSNGVTVINLTDAFDFTEYSCVKISWNPKAFRGKRNFTIRYVFDGKTLHEDVFENAKEAVSERIIEMVQAKQP